MRMHLLRAGVIATLVSLASICTTASAHAITVSRTSATSQQVNATTSICTDSVLGGAFYCDGSTNGEAWYQFPNGLWQLFVIGTNNAVYTRWQESDGTYHAWYSMGGYSSSYPVVLTGSGYSPQINVVGGNGSYWYFRVRNAATHSWSAWACCA